MEYVPYTMSVASAIARHHGMVDKLNRDEKRFEAKQKKQMVAYERRLITAVANYHNITRADAKNLIEESL